MAKKVQPLMATQVKQAKPKEKEYNLGDGDGLSLKVKPIGNCGDFHIISLFQEND